MSVSPYGAAALAWPRPEVFIKQGATLQLLLAVTNADGSVFDLSGVTVTAQVRDPVALALLTSLTPVVTDTPGQLSITQATDAWAPGRYLCDLKFFDAATGIVMKSETFAVLVVAAVTT